MKHVDLIKKTVDSNRESYSELKKWKILPTYNQQFITTVQLLKGEKRKHKWIIYIYIYIYIYD